MSDSSKRKHQAEILIVDDAPDNLNTLRDILGGAGYRVRMAINGALALQAAQEKRPDLILLDVIMPGIDGIETCRLLKSDSRTESVPVLIISAMDRTQDKLRGLEAGAADYVAKPFSAEEVLTRVRTHLRLQELGKQLDLQHEGLREAERLRDDVDKMLRHDLKGPLNAIIGYAQLLKEPDGADQVGEFSQIIEESGYVMLNMIHESFDLLKMERGTYELKPVTLNLVSLVQRVLLECRSVARQKRLEFVTHFTPVTARELLISGENLLCRSLLHNIFKNAVEAAPAGSVIRIHFETGARGRVSITNEGEVPEAIRNCFFDKFVTKGKDGGSGLGTYSARRMVETQRGNIHLDSSKPGETTLIVELPLAHPIPPPPEPVLPPAIAVADTVPAEKIALLFADDDVSNHHYIRRILNSPTQQVTTCANGRQALNELLTHRYSVALIDLEMPELDGFAVVTKYQQALDQLPASVSIKRTVFLALTGHDAPSVRKRCLDSGFSRLLAKPIKPADLRLEIQRQIASAESLPPAGKAASSSVEVDPDLAELIPGFIASRIQQVPELKAAIQAHESERVRKLCHRLKGSCALYGFPTASDYYIEIGSLMERGDYLQASQKCDALPAYWHSLSLHNSENY